MIASMGNRPAVFAAMVIAALGLGGGCGGGSATTKPDAGGTGGTGTGGRGTGGAATGGAGTGGAGTGGAATGGTGTGGTGTGGAGTGGVGTGGAAGGAGIGGAGTGGAGAGGIGGGSAGRGGSGGAMDGSGGGGASGSGGAAGGTISYAACSFVGGINRVVIAQRDTARALCVVLVLDSPGSNPFNLALPQNTGTEFAYAMPAEDDCRQRFPPPTGAASATAGTGSVVAFPTPQPTYSVDVTLTFQPNVTIGVGSSEHLMVSNILAGANCP